MNDDLLRTKRLWLSAQDLAEELSVSRSTAYTLVGQGVFGLPVKLKGCVRVNRYKVIQALRDSQERASAEYGIVDRD